MDPVVGARIPIAANVSFAMETMWFTVFAGDVSGLLGSVSINSAGYLLITANF